NRARLETPQPYVKRKSASPASPKIHRGTNVERRTSLSQNRRRSPFRGDFSVGDSWMGSPRADTPTANQEPVSSLHQRRCAPAKKSALPAQGSRTERRRHRADAEARGRDQTRR